MIIYSFDCAIKNLGFCCIQVDNEWRDKIDKLINEVDNFYDNQPESKEEIIKQIYNILKNSDQILSDQFKILYINVFDLVPFNKAKSIKFGDILKRLKYVVYCLEKQLPPPDVVLIEYQMNINDKSRGISRYIEEHFTPIGVDDELDNHLNNELDNGLDATNKPNSVTGGTSMNITNTNRSNKTICSIGKPTLSSKTKSSGKSLNKSSGKSLTKSSTKSPATLPFKSLTDPLANPTADPLTDPLANPTADPLTDPLANPTADPLTDPLANPTANPPTVLPTVQSNKKLPQITYAINYFPLLSFEIPKNQLLCAVHIVSAGLKNNYNIDPSAGGKYEIFAQKYSRSYDANKAHSIHHFKYFLNKFNLNYIIQDCPNKLDDLSDAFMMAYAWCKKNNLI